MPRFLLLLTLLLAPVAHADRLPEAVHPAAEILGRLLHDNAQFARTHDQRYFEPFRDQQHPGATVVMCADSRVQTHALSAAPDGDLFVVRNIGNQIDNNEGSVAYGIRHLHTPLLLIVGHVHCGAVKAAMGDYSEEPPAIRRELGGLHLSVVRTDAHGMPEERWLANVVGNVHQQVRNALQEYADEIRAGTLIVVGAVYDFRDDLGQGAGRLVLVDVNGECDPAKIAASPLLKAARAASVGR